MIKNKKISGKNLFRFFQSEIEYDDTSKFNPRKNLRLIRGLNFQIKIALIPFDKII